MKIKTALLSVLLIISICACNTASKTPDTSETAPAGEPLTLFFMGAGDMESQPLYLLAQEFMKQRKGAVIEFSYFNSNSFSDDELEKAMKKLNDGAGPDITESGQILNINFLGRTMELADLKEMMDRDLNFASSDYFENVLDAYAAGGKMYAAPLAISFDFFSLNKKYEDLIDKPFEQYGTVNFRQMLDIYEMAAREHRGGELYLTDFPLLNEGVSWAYDLNGMDWEASLEFVSPPGSLELLSRWLDIPELDIRTYFSLIQESPGLEGVERVFGSEGTDIGNNLGFYVFDYPQSGYTKPVVFAGLNGDVAFNCYQSLAINEKCGSKELAWEFVKFCMDNKPIPADDGGQSYAFNGSVNRESFAESYKQILANLYEINAEKGYLPSKSKSDSVLDGVDFMLGMAEKCNRFDRVNYYKLDYYYDYLTNYREGNQTFEKTVENIERVMRGYIDELIKINMNTKT